MPTITQLIKYGRKAKKSKTDAPALKGSPQKHGTVVSATVRKPKKPNSANRMSCRVRLSNGRVITCYVPGEAMGRHITEHTNLLVRGGGPPDLPGVKYTVIPGGKGMIPGAEGWTHQNKPRRNKARSRYGVKKKR